MNPIAKNLSTILKDIAETATSCQRDPKDIRLLAVSKTHPIETIQRAVNAGQKQFGENYAQELISKAETIGPNFAAKGGQWIFIGHLQSNKIAKIVQVASEIQTAASEKHLRTIAKHAEDLEKTPFPVMVAVNAAGESQKSGVSPEEVPALCRLCHELPALKLTGLMSVPPKSYKDPDGMTLPQVPPLYARLWDLALEHASGGLSLGMSGDLRIAIAAGSTCVRIGRGIFGERRIG